MKTIGNILLWILGIFTWLMFFISMWAGDTNNGTNTHLIILIITGVCLALYILKKTGAGVKDLERENQELKAENEKLKAELDQQLVQRVMDKVENRGEGR